MPLRRVGILLLLGWLAVASAGAAGSHHAAEGRFERTLAVSGPVRLEVTTYTGSITVRTGPEGAVSIRAALRVHADRYENPEEARRLVRLLEKYPPIEHKGRRVRVGRIRDAEVRRNIAISYEILVPPDSDVRSDTSLGDQVMEGRLRRVEAESGAGDVLVAGATGAVRARTEMGDVAVRDVGGTVEASSRAGHIRARGEPEDRWKLDTALGDVVLELPPSARFDLHARCGLGRIDVMHPVEADRASGATELRGKVRGGGPRLELATGLGSIRVECGPAPACS